LLDAITRRINVVTLVLRRTPTLNGLRRERLLDEFGEVRPTTSARLTDTAIARSLVEGEELTFAPAPREMLRVARDVSTPREMLRVARDVSAPREMLRVARDVSTPREMLRVARDVSAPREMLRVARDVSAPSVTARASSFPRRKDPKT
jgi:hypothetical protein